MTEAVAVKGEVNKKWITQWCCARKANNLAKKKKENTTVNVVCNY